MSKSKLRLIGITIMFITAVLIADYAIITHTPQNNPEPQATTPVKLRILFGKESNEPNTASLKITASYHIRVYRNGKLIAEEQKEDDPISIQWYRMVANMMFGFIRSGAITWYDTSYIARTWVDTGLVKVIEDTPTAYYKYPTAYIVLGSGTDLADTNNYRMSNEITKDIPSMTVTDDTVNQRYIITYTKSFTIQQNFTLTEVGLELYLDASNTNEMEMVYLLLARDLLNTSISLVVGDSVSITYQLTIPYNTNGVFTKWFFNALINYWLGYRGTTGSTYDILKTEDGNTGGIDTAVDTAGYDDFYNEFFTPAEEGVNGEYVYIEVGNNTSTISPLYETYSLANRVQRLSTTDTQAIAEIDEVGNFTIRYIITFTFTEQVTITEIGLSYYTDIDTSRNFDDGYYLWCYWSLPSPVSVDAGDGLRVEITIEIPYT